MAKSLPISIKSTLTPKNAYETAAFAVLLFARRELRFLNILRTNAKRANGYLQGHIRVHTRARKPTKAHHLRCRYECPRNDASLARSERLCHTSRPNPLRFGAAVTRFVETADRLKPKEIMPLNGGGIRSPAQSLSTIDAAETRRARRRFTGAGGAGSTTASDLTSSRGRCCVARIACAGPLGLAPLRPPVSRGKPESGPP